MHYAEDDNQSVEILMVEGHAALQDDCLRFSNGCHIRRVAITAPTYANPIYPSRDPFQSEKASLNLNALHGLTSADYSQGEWARARQALHIHRRDEKGVYSIVDD